MNLQDALDRFLAQLQADGRAPGTISQYRRHVMTLIGWAGDRSVESITHEDVAAFLAAPETRASRWPVTMNAIRTSVRGVFRYLHEAGIIPTDPARIVRRALCASPPPRWLRDDDRDRLLGTIAANQGFEAQRDHTLFTFLSGTGARIGATVALDVADIDREQRVATLRQSKAGRPARHLLPTAVLDRLLAFIGPKTDGALFTDRHGRRVTVRQVQRRFRNWLRVAGIGVDVGPHALRHGFAIRLLERTSDLRLVQTALHHASIQSTTIYTGVCETRLRQALEG